MRSVLYVMAHPDDEDASTITWLARDQGVRVTIFSLTRGESGDNSLGSEGAEALGLLRTHEMLRAARAYGAAQVLFGSCFDYGYSKRVEEAYARWGEKRIVGDIVRAIRSTQPTVVITRFLGEPGDGHAHHRAVGAAARIAFVQAADANVFSDQGLSPWQAARLFGEVSGPVTGGIDVDAGARCTEIAAAGYRQHESQAVSQTLVQAQHHSYRLLGAAEPNATAATTFFDGLGASDAEMPSDIELVARASPGEGSGSFRVEVRCEGAALETVSLASPVGWSIVEEGDATFHVTATGESSRHWPTRVSPATPWYEWNEGVPQAPLPIALVARVLVAGVETELSVPVDVESARGPAAREILCPALPESWRLDFSVAAEPPSSLRFAAGSAPRALFLNGTGDCIADALGRLGTDIRSVDPDALTASDLSGIDTVFVGVRAYSRARDRAGLSNALVATARAGVHVVVLMQTPEYDPNRDAPFPATLGDNPPEVCEEDAPVEILDSEQPLVSLPHEITDADFRGWIEQRGSKLWSAWDARYEPLLSTHDTNEPSQLGVWLTAAVGAGRYTYCALALHRQLPFGVVGAYRILANLAAAGRV